MPFIITTHTPSDPPQIPNLILPIQTHSAKIIEIQKGTENLENCDGIYTHRNNNFTLGIKTADCAAISFYDNSHYGIIHAGWRGLLNGIVEDMLDKFHQPIIHVSPLLQVFEIQKDDCYQQIHSKFSDKFFFETDQKIHFHFQLALKSLLPTSAIFDPRDTFQTKELASWRRDKTPHRNITIISPRQI